MYSSPRIKNKLKFMRLRMHGKHKKYAQKFGLEQIVRRHPLGIEGKCDCNINVNGMTVPQCLKTGDGRSWIMVLPNCGL
jgi:hypothetical protein